MSDVVPPYVRRELNLGWLIWETDEGWSGRETPDLLRLMREKKQRAVPQLVETPPLTPSLMTEGFTNDSEPKRKQGGAGQTPQEDVS